MRIAIIGAGLTGATLARLHSRRGDTVHVFEAREVPGGNIVEHRSPDGSGYHVYGPHIFHTTNPSVLRFLGEVQRGNPSALLAPFHYWATARQGRPVEVSTEEWVEEYRVLGPIPINFFSFSRVYPHMTTPRDVRRFLEARRGLVESVIETNGNFEEVAIARMGMGAYETFFKEYTEDYWGRPASSLPGRFALRLPIRWTTEQSYFPAQEAVLLPTHSYDHLIKAILGGENVSVELSSPIGGREHAESLAKQYDLVWWTGRPEVLVGETARLAYRTSRFIPTTYVCDDEDVTQESPAVHYTRGVGPFYCRRVVDYQFFGLRSKIPTEGSHYATRVLEKPCPADWEEGMAPGMAPLYPVRDEKSMEAFVLIQEEVKREFNGRILLAGRLGSYQYLDMDDAIAEAIKAFGEVLEGR